ncbi:MAG: acyl-ACP--UDP-N-acetylglucosamine O-acyltransferase [Gemmatimonadales bacterium]
MTTTVHPTAIIDSAAELGEGVAIGPFAIIGPNVVVGDHTSIGPHATLERDVTLGSEVRIGQGAVIGGDPQDLKYRGEGSVVRVGDRTIIREYATVNRGTEATGETVVGEDCFLMTYVHVAHDCVLYDHVIIANGTQMAGHVTIQDHVVISGLVVIHQFCTIGSYAFIAGGAGVLQDIPPYTKALERKLYGLNSVGLQRAGFSSETVQALKRAYRLVFNSKLNLTQAVARARAELPMLDEVKHFLDFVESSGRGVTA